MPQLHAAAKDLRKNARRAKRNRTATVAFEVAVRKFRKALTGSDRSVAEAAYRAVVKLADRSASKGVMPRNRAARVKSRFARSLRSVSAASERG